MPRPLAPSIGKGVDDCSPFPFFQPSSAYGGLRCLAALAELLRLPQYYCRVEAAMSINEDLDAGFVGNKNPWTTTFCVVPSGKFGLIWLREIWNVISRLTPTRELTPFIVTISMSDKALTVTRLPATSTRGPIVCSFPPPVFELPVAVLSAIVTKVSRS